MFDRVDLEIKQAIDRQWAEEYKRADEEFRRLEAERVEAEL